MIKTCINLTEEQKRFLDKKSKKTGVSISSYLRLLIEDVMLSDIIKDIEIEKAKEIKRRKSETEIISY